MANPNVALLARDLVSKPFATLGEIAADRQKMQSDQLRDQLAVSTMQLQQRRLADEEAASQAEAAKAQKAAQRQAMVQATVQKYTDPTGKLDQEGLLKELRYHDLDAYNTVSASLNKGHEEARAAQKAENDARVQRAQQVAAIIRDATPETWPQRRAEALKVEPEAADVLPEQYDQPTIEHVAQVPLSMSEFYGRSDKLKAETNSNLGESLVDIALAETPEQLQNAFHGGDVLGVTKQLQDRGITMDAVSQMTPEQRRMLLYRAPGVTPTAIAEAFKPKAAAGGVNAGSFEDYVLRYAKEKNKAPEAVTTAEIEQLRKRYQQADDRPPSITVNTGAGSDVAETVHGMKDGSLPPQLPGRASKEYIALMAEAHRQGFDLAGAATDWVATQKHIASLNGAQQLRLNQAVNQLPELLDSVDALASKWKAGRFPMLNSATLKLAKAGTLGRDAATIANQLDAQIADVTGDLGAVYMGGNSPTDHSLQLAEKALRSDWDEKVLHDMVALARKNVQTRRNSISNTGVQGASAGNPYAPAATPSAAPANLDPAALRQRYNY